MTIYQSSRSMTSSSTPEWAWRIAGREEPAWQLSWLSIWLTREQALAGMELAEILGRPDLALDRSAQRRAAALADQLGTTVQQALIQLHQRMHDRQQRETPSPRTHMAAGTILEAFVTEKRRQA